MLQNFDFHIYIPIFEYLAQTVTTDERSWLMHRLMSMNIKGTSVYLYPRIYPLVCRLILTEKIFCKN